MDYLLITVCSQMDSCRSPLSKTILNSVKIFLEFYKFRQIHPYDLRVSWINLVSNFNVRNFSNAYFCEPFVPEVLLSPVSFSTVLLHFSLFLYLHFFPFVYIPFPNLCVLEMFYLHGIICFLSLPVMFDLGCSDGLFCQLLSFCPCFLLLFLACICNFVLMVCLLPLFYIF